MLHTHAWHGAALTEQPPHLKALLNSSAAPLLLFNAAAAFIAVFSSLYSSVTASSLFLPESVAVNFELQGQKHQSDQLPYPLILSPSCLYLFYLVIRKHGLLYKQQSINAVSSINL